MTAQESRSGSTTSSATMSQLSTRLPACSKLTVTRRSHRGLDLAQAPFGFIWMTHHRVGYNPGVHGRVPSVAVCALGTINRYCCPDQKEETGMADDDAARLTGLLVSRLCHDLVGRPAPSPTVWSFARTLPWWNRLWGLCSRPAVNSISASSFYRRAYGMGANMTLDEACDLTFKFLTGRRHALNWNGADEAPAMDEAMQARLAMNLVLCAIDVLPAGGEISLSGGETLACRSGRSAGRSGNPQRCFRPRGPYRRHSDPSRRTALLGRHIGGSSWRKSLVGYRIRRDVDLKICQAKILSF